MSAPRTVLLVDDEPLFIESLRDALKQHDPTLDLLCAADGVEALQELSREPVNLLVTDLKMPRLDGFGLLEKLVEHNYSGPVVVMTAFGTAAVERQVYDGGAVHFLEKPIELDELIHLIDELTLEPTESYRTVDLCDFAMLLAAERGTGIVRVRGPKGFLGKLDFLDGVLIGAKTIDAAGDQAALELFELHEPGVVLRDAAPSGPGDVAQPLEELILQARMKRDPSRRASPRQTQSVDLSLALKRLRSPEEQGLFSHPTENPGELQMNVNEALAKAKEIDGAVGAAIVDYQSGMTLGTVSDGTMDLELAAAGNAEVVKSKMAVMASLQLEGNIEDILITLENQYHLIRPFAQSPNIFFYLALHKGKSNLALARHKLKSIEEAVDL